MRNKEVYLDYNAHAPMDPAVLAVLSDAYAGLEANPHSRHPPGDRARRRLEAARAKVASCAGPGGVIFTSGATEANNMVFEGLSAHLAAIGRKRVAVASTEHPSVLAPAERLRGRGFDVVVLPVGRDGICEPATMREALGEGVGLVSVAAANHEIGVVQPLAAIAEVARGAGAMFHSDLSQAFGKVSLSHLDYDIASISSHKICGPVGIGAIHASRRARSRLQPSALGGGQEGGLRSGTVPVPLCEAFAAACSIAVACRETEGRRVAALRDDLLSRLSAAGGVTLNGSRSSRLPGNINVCVEDVDGEALAMRVADAVSISTGSACRTGSLEPSPVLLAIGLAPARAETAIRIGLGRFTTPEDVEVAAARFLSAILELRAVRRRSAA